MGWRQILIAFLALLAAPVALAAQVTVTVDWPSWAEENTVRIYDATNTTALTPVFDDGPRSGSNLSFQGSQTYTLADNTSFTLRMTDSYGDGWNGAASVIVEVDGVQVLSTTLPSGFAGTATFDTFPPPLPAPTTTQVCTALTGTWTGGTASSGGISVTRVLGNGAGATWDPTTAGNMNTINGWSTTAVQGQASTVETILWTNSGDTGTFTLNFGKQVTNPVIHIDRIGGFSGTAANSSIWTLSSPGTLYRLAGPTHFETYADGSFNRTVGESTANNAESSLSGASGTAPGSVMIEGTMSSVSFNVTGDQVGGGAAGDAVEIVVCVPQNDLSLTKVVDDPTPVVGQDVTYTLTLNNAGPQVSDGTEVTDLLPAGLTFVSATPSQGTYDENAGIWDVGTLGISQTVTLDITATVTGSGTITNDAEVTAAGYTDIDSDPGDGTGDDFASVDITATAPTPVSCPAGSAADGRATSGTGAFRNEIYWLDWSCGGVTQFNPGDQVTKSWDAGNGVTLTAQISNITATIQPYNTGDWAGDVLDGLYGGINPIGLANAITGEDPQFDISFSATLNGVPIAADIVVADAEDAATSNEAAVFTTDGTAFQPIEATGVLDATFSNAGRTLRLDDVPSAGGGTMLALSESVSTISLDLRGGGVSAAAFGVFLPFDHGDASGYGTSQAHYNAVSASGGSQPTSATAVTSLTLASVSYGGSLYLGSTAPDTEDGNQSSANATGDDTDGTDDEDGVTFPTLTQGQAATISVDVTQASANDGYLQAFIDWNGDGDFDDAGEQVATNLQSASAGTSTISVPVTVPANATTSQTIARFRWSTTSGLDTTTAAPDGEVEDYALTVQVPPVIDLNSAADPADADRDFAATYTEGDAPVSVTDADAGLYDGGEGDIANLRITLGGVAMTSDDTITIGGADIDPTADSVVMVTVDGQTIDIEYEAATGTFILQGPGTGELPASVWSNLIRSITYSSASENPVTGDRTFTIEVSDDRGVTFASSATSTITVTPVNDPPVIDLDADDSSGATGADYQDTFTENGAPIAISDVGDTSLTDADDTELLNVTITLTNPQVGDVIRVDGTPVNDGDSLGIFVNGVDVDMTVTELPGGELQILFESNIDIATLQAAIEQVTFENTSENPSTVDRVITVSAFDGDANSNLATSTITVTPVNDPPTLDFDGDDSSGTTGADYATSFAAGDAPVSMSDTDVSITDADDTATADGSSVTLSGFVDTGNEIVTIGGAAFTIGTANVPNVTVGNTTFEIDSDGGDFAITIVAGTGEIADWEALFASMTYEHTSATPTPGDRVLSFTVRDPDGAVSNVATSTVTVNATPTDLALSFDPPSGTPVIGFPYTVTLNLENESLVNATGVAVSFPLPAGWTYVSDDTGGNYDPATGLWTVGQSNAGATETVEFSLVPLVSGPYDLTAEVSAANENDADSTPGNGVGGEDDQAGLAPSPQLGTGTAIPAQTCSSGSVQTLDWDSETWAAGTRSASFSYAGVSVDVDITDPQGALDGTPNGPMPVAGPFYQGGLASVQSTLIYETNDADLANGDVLTTISFGRAVDEVRLSLFDIDFSSLGPRLERVEIRGFNGASAVPVILDGGPAISINAAEAVGVDESDPIGAASGDGTVSIAFDQPVDRIEIDYGHAPGTDRSGNPGHPGFALHDISFCGGTALLTGSKSVTVYTGSATNPDLYAIPGEDVVYAITVENTGTGPSDADTIELIDAMPPEVSFYTGTTPEFGGTVIDWDETGTGLTFTPANDVAYSNSTSGAPADFSACTYTPVGSYDPNVTYVCFNPKGSMASGSQFTVSFRARIE